MTVSSTTSRADANGNGVTTAFTASFRILDQTHITVLRTQISTGVVKTLALTTDYTVSGVGGSSFTVTCPVAPTADQRLSILRNVPFTQLTDYVEGDPFPAATHEDALDKLMMQVQQLDEVQDRALTLAPNSTGISVELPEAEASALIGWNAAADALVNYTSATTTPVTAFAETLLDDTTAAEARTTLGVAPLAARVSVATVAGTVDITASAPNSDDILFTGTNTPTAFTIAVGRVLRCKANAAFTLTNNASIVTGTGANLSVSAGATFMLRATAADTVEVLGYCEPVLQQALGGTGTNQATRQIAQVQESFSGAVATGTTVIPWDDTIPQSGEGDQYYSVAITPLSSTSTLQVEAILNISANSATAQLTAAIFLDSETDARAANSAYMPAVNQPMQVVVNYTMTSGSTSAKTFKLRGGNSVAGTTTINGSAGSGKLGGVHVSGIRVTEILA